MSSAAPRPEPPAGHGSEPDPSPEFVTSVFAAACTSRAVFEDVTSKWASLVLLALGESPYRFGELRRRVEGVSEKMLSQTLQSLERDGLLVREVRSAIPPHVDYSLTELGAEAAARLRALADLFEGSTAQVERARASYRRVP